MESMLPDRGWAQEVSAKEVISLVLGEGCRYLWLWSNIVTSDQ